MRKSKIAECVGLWLAEGDSKTNSEITFTNNSEELIKYFRSIIEAIYDGKNRARIYSYSSGIHFKSHFKGLVVKKYLDKRANRPYHIYRLADTNFVRKWKILVQECVNDPQFHPDILRGIFAGEGNIKTGSHGNRTLRISQKSHNEEFEKIFKTLRLTSSYSKGNRMYNFAHKENWDIFAKHHIADLHPEKRGKFWESYLSYKEEHYRVNFIKNQLLDLLNVPRTKQWLAEKFNRSGARLYDVLEGYKKEGKIAIYRCGSRSYWIKKDTNTLLISKRKQLYFEIVEDKPKTTAEIAKEINVGWKASFRRLCELKKLGLIKQRDMRWEVVKCNKKVMVL